MEPSTALDTPRPRGLLGSFNELLTRPLALLERARDGGEVAPGRLFAGATVCYVLYGAAAGFFQGGDQILVSAFKAPLIIFFSLLLCLPSLYVCSAVAGAEWTRKTFLAVLAGFAGTLGLLLIALLPVNWLFSISSRHLSSATLLHFVLWILALALAWRFLGRALRTSGATGAVRVWLVLFCIVSLQATTFLRPVLERKEGAPVFVSGKKSFLEHMGDVFD